MDGVPRHVRQHSRQNRVAAIPGGASCLVDKFCRDPSIERRTAQPVENFRRVRSDQPRATLRQQIRRRIFPLLYRATIHRIISTDEMKIWKPINGSSWIIRRAFLTVEIRRAH